MTVKLDLMRDQAEALYHAAIYKMRREPIRSHLWEAAINIRVSCGMHHSSANPVNDAINAVDADIKKENK